MATEGIAFGPDGSDPELAELARLADDLVDQTRAARRHYDDLRAALAEQDTSSDDGSRATIDEAHLAALSMAVNGSTREDARSHLCDAFGIAKPDAEEILDEAFGVRLDDAALDQSNGRRFVRLSRETA
jgi:hypothetical protein